MTTTITNTLLLGKDASLEDGWQDEWMVLFWGSPKLSSLGGRPLWQRAAATFVGLQTSASDDPFQPATRVLSKRCRLPMAGVQDERRGASDIYRLFSSFH
jgi:hypothetical protein